MDISVANKEENTKKDKKPVGKGKKDDKKTKPPAGVPETRNRAKSTVVNTFEQKKGQNQKKDLKPIETIGGDRFKNLLSMFDKKPDPDQSKEEAGPKKLDMSKFAFGKNESNGNDNSGIKKNSDVADSIKKRMEALLSNNKENARSGSCIDPVLEQRRKQKELEANYEEGEIDEDYDDESEENLHISEDEDDKKEDSDKEEKEEVEKDEDKEEEQEEQEDNKNEDNGNLEIENQKKESEKKEEYKNIEYNEEEI